MDSECRGMANGEVFYLRMWVKGPLLSCGGELLRVNMPVLYEFTLSDLPVRKHSGFFHGRQDLKQQKVIIIPQRSSRAQTMTKTMTCAGIEPAIS